MKLLRIGSLLVLLTLWRPTGKPVVLLVLGWMSDFNAERIEMKVRIVEK